MTTPQPKRRKFKDLTGLKKGRWRVLRLNENSGKRLHWWCICECGTTKTVEGYALTSGKSVSCGCLQREAVRAANTKHGAYRTPEYSIWTGMRFRCSNPDHPSYHRYGGRGITVCERWNSFEAFLEDMGPRPTTLHTIERVNNNIGYTPQNCVWATRAQQSRNISSNSVIEFEGRIEKLVDVSDRTGIPINTLHSRAFRQNMGVHYVRH